MGWRRPPSSSPTLAIGARHRPAFERSLTLTILWGYVVAAAVGTVLWFAGPVIIDLMTTNAPVRAAARDYLPYAALVPVGGTLAYQMDGVFIGATWSRDMRNMMLVSLAVYLAAWWARSARRQSRAVDRPPRLPAVRGGRLYLVLRSSGSGSPWPADQAAGLFGPALDAVARSRAVEESPRVSGDWRIPATIWPGSAGSGIDRGRYRAGPDRRRRGFVQGRIGGIDAADADAGRSGPSACASSRARRSRLEQRRPTGRRSRARRCRRPQRRRERVVLETIRPSMPAARTSAAMSASPSSSRSGAIFRKIGGWRGAARAPPDARQKCAKRSPALQVAQAGRVRRGDVDGQIAGDAAKRRDAAT